MSKISVCFLIVTCFCSLSCGKQIDISTYITTTNLGTIRPSPSGEITRLKILNAFIRANPNLPPELKKTKLSDAILHTSIIYSDNRAIIDTIMNLKYTGSVQVTYNGCPKPRETYIPPDLGSGNNYRSALNLSTIKLLNTNLGRLPDNLDETIIDAFMELNSGLPCELGYYLKVNRSNIKKGRAGLHPERSERYEGNVIVHFSV